MNKYNPNIHQRKSIRLKGYDYSQAGLYFVTICIQDRECLLGDISNRKMHLNDAGKMVENEWLKLTNRFDNIKLHEFVVMPNHFHAILEIVRATLVVAQNNMVIQNDVIQNDVINLKMGQPQGIAPTKTLGDIVGAFQSIVTVKYIRGVKNNNWHPFDGKLWQRNYWEHIIRNDNSYQTISDYIVNNPLKWSDDKFNPNAMQSNK